MSVGFQVFLIWYEITVMSWQFIQKLWTIIKYFQLVGGVKGSVEGRVCTEKHFPMNVIVNNKVKRSPL